MGLFNAIWDKIRGHKTDRARAKTAPAAAPRLPVQAATVTPAAAPPAPSTPQPVDVEAVLEQMAEMKGGGGNWRTSIVDLLKLLELDSSLEARKELAQELSVSAGAHGSAEQNVALIKALWRQLAANGGQVPSSLRD